MFAPAYIELYHKGKLQEAAERLYAFYDHCELCPRKCGVNRGAGETGTCGAGAKVKISSAQPHYGEERPLVGRRGSGTIFLTYCSLLCLYCQNWDISHSGEGDEISDELLADAMLRLQQTGCHNINFVTPTHFLPNIVQALVFAVEKGLNVPIVYNSGGYERVEILRMLDGIIDIYMPDFKYSEGKTAAKFSRGVSDYPGLARTALKEMHRQVGVLQLDEDNIAQRGLIIRHLVLPNDLAGTDAFLKFVAEELHPNTYLNIMAQYRPCFRAHNYPELSRGITAAEFNKALMLAQKYKLFNLD
ncbi:MAG: radical SAM protein [Candidatus Aminicenantes bacterium]|nr:radical SAM protein [Candidatus Aminicenantes bacterium]